MGSGGAARNKQANTYLITNLGLRCRGKKGVMGEEITRPALGSLLHVNLAAVLPWEINIPILQMRILRPSKVKQGLRSHRELVAMGTSPV